MNRSCHGVILLLLVMCISGCAQTRYTWNNYDQKLFDHYKAPADSARFIQDLKEVVIAAEESGKVPPGLYAEYGYALYEKGDTAEAMTYFAKEQKKWPESSLLMSKMMKIAGKRLAATEQRKGADSGVTASKEGGTP